MFSRRFSISLCAIAMAFSLTSAAFGQELQGADAALKAAEAARSAKIAGTDPAGAFRRELADLKANAAKLPAAEAAKRWLTDYDTLAKGIPQSPGSMMGVREDLGFAQVVEALPAPESWPAIANGLRQRAAKGPKGAQSAGLALFAEMLSGDAASQWKAMAGLMPYRTANNGPGYYVTQIYTALAQRTGDRARMVNAMKMMAATTDRPGSDEMANVPDLVTLVGPAEAEKSLLNLLTTSKKRLYITQGKRTQELAAKLALQHAKELKVAQWYLVDSPAQTALYEALVARFGAPKATAGDYSPAAQGAARARYFYLLGLLQQGREAEASKLAKTLGANAFAGAVGTEEGLQELVGTPRFTGFLAGLVKNDPKSPLWDLYTVSATKSRQLPELIASLKAALGQPKIAAGQRSSLRSRLANAYFAIDDIDEGLATLKKVVDEEPPKGGDDGTYNAAVYRYIQIGHLLNRPEVVRHGIERGEKFESQAAVQEMGFNYGEGLTDVLMEIGMPAEAEKLAIEAYAKTTAESNQSMAMMGSPDQSLIRLVQIYYLSDRPTDVRLLLDRSNAWNVDDAADLTNPSPYGMESEPITGSVGFIAAWALAKTGEKAKAERLLYRVLSQDSGFDPAYALLLELKGAEAIPVLDGLYEADQFQERPLIWKAVALKNAGKLEEAEEAVRKAISIDPSDGETHGGHRMYAYAVLADIREARGDAEQAKDYRAAVSAIRTAEKADDLLQAGLVTRALSTYEASLGMFSDAYCIQSRLAVQLMEEGRPKEAEEHYRRAYQLMPESFGRVETHCMGCEGVFEGTLAQNIAEETFTRLVKEEPNKPQVHYLLGFLRESQGRFAEAAALYRKAVELDPEYLNAWKRLSELSGQVSTPPEQQRKIADAILRLDPLQKHGDTGGAIGADLKQVWRYTEKALAAQGIREEGPIYPLPASATELERLKATGYSSSWSGGGYGESVTSGGAAIARNGVMQPLIGLITMGLSMGGASEAFETVEVK